MEQRKTYEELMQCVPVDVQEEFRQIEEGKRLPNLSSDIVFKKVFNPDLHKERVEKLLTLIFREKLIVSSSLNQQIPKATIFAKDTVHDMVAKLTSGAVANLEMQAIAQEFIVERMDIYASDMILLQYAINEGEKKKDFLYTDVKPSYLVVFMKKSPMIFKDSSEFIHFKKSVTDTGIELNQLALIVYIELDKCLKYIKKQGYHTENKELYKWLVMLADVNDKEVNQLIVEDPEKAKIIEELNEMSKSKEELIEVLSEKYAEATRSSELVYAKREAEKLGRQKGRQEGRQEGRNVGIQALIETLNEMMVSEEDVMKKVMTKFSLSEEETIKYMKQYWR